MYSFSIEDEFSARIRKKKLILDNQILSTLTLDSWILWNLLTSFSNRI